MNFSNSISQEVNTLKIYLIRGLRIMINSDLAELYGVETKVLNQAVKPNVERFPEDFMFKLSKKEFAQLEVTICDLKLGRSKKYAKCIY
jgi:hypothetical protein